MLQSGHGRRDRRTDGQTDGRTDGVKPIYPPTTSLFGGYNDDPDHWCIPGLRELMKCCTNTLKYRKKWSTFCRHFINHFLDGFLFFFLIAIKIYWNLRPNLWQLNINSGIGSIPLDNNLLPEPNRWENSPTPYGIARPQWVNVLKALGEKISPRKHDCIYFPGVSSVTLLSWTCLMHQ